METIITAYFIFVFCAWILTYQFFREYAIDNGHDTDNGDNFLFGAMALIVALSWPLAIPVLILIHRKHNQ